MKIVPPDRLLQAIPNDTGLIRYLNRGITSTEGWLNPEAVSLILSTALIQTDGDLSGGIVEIGVHHGKLMILLALLVQKDEKGIAIDLFDQQEQNVDNSGLGSIHHFTSNLASYGLSEDDIAIWKKNSLEIDHQIVLEELGGSGARMFSVDGGHYPEIVVNDLAIAFGSIREGGAVILDDYFNPGWPGVSEGFHQFLQTTYQGSEVFLLQLVEIKFC